MRPTRTFQDLVLLLAVALLVLFVAFLVIAPFFGRSYRRIDLVAGQMTLADAYRDYTESGSLTNYPTNHVWLSSNVVTIGSTQYQCLLQLCSSRFDGQGTLAMTTNHIYIWLDSNGPPKIIGPGYRPPLSGY